MVITGASSGIGLVTAFKVAQAGGIPVLVARGKDKLEAAKAAIEARGGSAHVYRCDLSDLEAIDELVARLTTELDSVDLLVNNAGRSIRRSVKLSQERFHDFERTMQLNYFGAIRLVMGLLPHDARAGIGARGQHQLHRGADQPAAVQRVRRLEGGPGRLEQRGQPRRWSGTGSASPTIHMPLVKTPMISPTTLYDRFPTITPAQAADMVVRALVERPFEINTTLGTVGALAHTLAPAPPSRCSTWPTGSSPTPPPPGGTPTRARWPPRPPPAASRSCWPG